MLKYVIIIVINFLFFNAVYAYNNTGIWEGGGCMMGLIGNWGGFGFGLGWIFMFLFWGLVILGVIALIQWAFGQGQYKKSEKSALDIIKERYAKGEIDKNEFEQKKKDLK